MKVYLDNSATTRAADEVVEVMADALQYQYGNPSSLHRMGIEAEKIVTRSREAVARVLGVRPECIIFTSGGTESNNLAIKGIARAKKREGKHLITSAVEHPSVLNTFRELEEDSYQVTYLDVDRRGRVNPDDLRRALRDDTIMVSIMHVNNEVGVVEPVAEIGEILRHHRKHYSGRGVVFHVDAVQSFVKIPVQPLKMGIDCLSISAHKIHGPKGIGALYIRKGLRLVPQLAGGGQEKGLRSGTENVPGIAGLGMAAFLGLETMDEAASRMFALKDRLVEPVLSRVPRSRLIGGLGPEDGMAPHIVNLSFPGLKGEVVVHALEEQGVYVSTGSACSSRGHDRSHVLVAMGLEPEVVDGAIRISFSRENTRKEIDYAAGVIVATIEELYSLYRG